MEMKTCHLPDDIIDSVLDAHNKLREAVATRSLEKDVFKNLKGTRSLFKLRYNRSEEALATATIADDCTRTSVNINALNRAQNFKIHRLAEKPKDEHISLYYRFAVEDWTDSVTKPFDSNATWNNRAAAPFANMIYDHTFTVGCAHRFCAKEYKLAISCVYGAKPKFNEALYIANSMDKRGCVSDSTCRRIVPGSVCSAVTNNSTTVKGPLCDVEADEDAPATTTEESGWKVIFTMPTRKELSTTSKPV
ncbi:SCP-like protein [Oesophagostomum dentatum]|uniref:SCP-like protein n=1 Tax=Oesophagostomum dentatum TaxID=61180 RepID=A0A0B1SSP1_OESDE|nr:SCP-like protein [Oesophagostomum dentatum]